MNGWQLFLQIRYLLRNQLWPVSGEVIFNPTSVLVSDGPEESAAAQLIPPIALIRPGTATSDPAHDEEPELVEQDILIRLVACVAGDEFGQGALIGANRIANDSRGRGLLEIEEQMLEAIRLLTVENGIQIYNRSRSQSSTNLIEEFGMVAWRDYTFEALITDARAYPAPICLQGVTSPGSVSLTWINHPDRFDRLEVVLRRVAGSTPTTSPTGGTGVTLSGPLATSVVDSPGTGTFSYSLFGGYDDSNPDGTPTTSNNFSAPNTLTVVIP